MKKSKIFLNRYQIIGGVIMRLYDNEEQQCDIMNDNLVVIEDDITTNTSYLMSIGTAVTPENINFMIKYGKGIVYVCISEETARILKLPYMDRSGGAKGLLKNSTISIDYKTTTTGISANERATTIKMLSISKNSEDFRQPGHIFPLIYKKKKNDFLKKPNIINAAYTLSQIVTSLKNTETTPVLCQILNKHGNIASPSEVRRLSFKHNLTTLTISEIIELHIKHLEWLKVTDYATIQIQNETIDVYKMDNFLYNTQICVYVNTKTKELKNFSFHKECLWGDILYISDKCDCCHHLKEHLGYLINGQVDCVVYQRYTANEKFVSINCENIINRQIKQLIQQKLEANLQKSSLIV